MLLRLFRREQRDIFVVSKRFSLATLAITDLPNTIPILTSSGDAMAISSCRVTANAGYQRESFHKQGVSHYWRRFMYKGTNRISGLRITRMIELLTSNFVVRTTYNHHEVQATFVHEKARNVGAVMADILRPRLAEWEFREVREIVRHDVEQRKQDPIGRILDKVQHFAYRGVGPGNTLYCPEHNINHIYPEDVAEFILDHCNAQDIHIVAATSHHDNFVDAFGASFTDFPKTGEPKGPLFGEYFGGTLFESTSIGGCYAIAFPCGSSSPRDEFSRRLLKNLFGSYHHKRFRFPGTGGDSRLGNGLKGELNIEFATGFSIENENPLFGILATGPGTCKSIALVINSIFESILHISPSEYQIAKDRALQEMFVRGTKQDTLMTGLSQFTEWGQGEFGDITQIHVKALIDDMLSHKPTIYANGDLYNMIL